MNVIANTLFFIFNKQNASVFGNIVLQKSQERQIVPYLFYMTLKGYRCLAGKDFSSPACTITTWSNYLPSPKLLMAEYLLLIHGLQAFFATQPSAQAPGLLSSDAWLLGHAEEMLFSIHDPSKSLWCLPKLSPWHSLTFIILPDNHFFSACTFNIRQ